jgi:hypothetical protein
VLLVSTENHNRTNTIPARMCALEESHWQVHLVLMDL